MKRLLIALAALMFAGVGMAQTNFTIMQDNQGNGGTLIRPHPTYVNARSLAANVAEDTTVPTGTKVILFASTCNFYAKPGGSATVPGDTTDGTASELNPAAWHNDSTLTTIGLIAPVACVVTISYYR